MKNQYILFRRAESNDIHSIWDLLHSESITWDDSKISNHISQIFVLTDGNKLLGALFSSAPDKYSVDWIAVHPMYPEKKLKDLMLGQLQSFFMISAEKTSGKNSFAPKSALNTL